MTNEIVFAIAVLFQFALGMGIGYTLGVKHTAEYYEDSDDE